jgi:ER lumen protein retaining receptor
MDLRSWDRDDKQLKVRDPLVVVIRWFQSRSPRERLILGGLGAFIVIRRPPRARPAPPRRRPPPPTVSAPAPQFLMILWRTIEDHDTLFVLAESAHFLGIGVLVYKLHTRKSVSGA